jgi:hypothetical protein
MANDDKTKLEIEVAIKDGFSVALKELAKQLEGANKKALELGQGTTTGALTNSAARMNCSRHIVGRRSTVSAVADTGTFDSSVRSFGTDKEEWMSAKKKTARGRKQDRARVAGGQDYEVRYTAKTTRKSASAVKNAVKKVGSSRKRVVKALKGSRKR